MKEHHENEELKVSIDEREIESFLELNEPGRGSSFSHTASHTKRKRDQLKIS